MRMLIVGITMIVSAMVGVPTLVAQAPEGIKVHGDWTIDIRQPDGTLAAHHVFRNALVVNGASALARLLSRHQVPGGWQLFLTGHSPQPCSVACVITESTHTSLVPAPYLFKNLTVAYDDGSVRLAGVATARNDSAISRVESWLKLCDRDMSQGNCLGELGRIFSERILATPIPVLTDQLIQVTVVFTFS
jgi:hypothetical protein